MSRCFPFPPPGYENKGRPDDLNLIIKEKHKQKKHKDKKDKDKKKERSERQDKERTEGKHKEDKDRKQKKHRYKKDNKKDKRKSSEEKKISGPSENQNGEKLSPDSKPGDGAHDCKILVELGKRVGNDDGPTDKKDKKKEKQEASEEKKIVGPSENQNGEKPDPYNKPGDGAHGCKILVEMGKRVRNDDKATNKKDKKKHKSSEEKNIVGPLGIQNGEKSGPDDKPDDGSHNCKILVEMGKRVRNDDVAKDNSHASMANGQSLRVDAKCSGNNWVGIFSGEKRIKVENGSYQANEVEKRKDCKEKNRGGLENKNRDKDKKEDKKRKKEEKKEKSKKKIKQTASNGNLVDFCANKPQDLLKESCDWLSKLKEPVLNGFLHDNGTRPDNLSGPAISSHQVSQNGNGSYPSQNNTIPLTMDKQAVITNQKVNGKLSSSQSVIKKVRNMEPGQISNNSTAEHLGARINNHVVTNGFISSHSVVGNGRETVRPNNTDKTKGGPRPVFVRETDNKDFGINSSLEDKKDISSQPSSASVKQPKEKSPHPDLKYLSQLLTVPKLDSPRFDDDDQDWIFGCKNAKNPEFGPSEIECTKRVWAEAIRLESADVIALPYVVPY